MESARLNDTPRLVTIFGGSGFLGRHAVRAFAKAGWRVRVAVRRPDLAFHLQPLGGVGQIQAVQANVRYPSSVARAVKDSDLVINLVGILTPAGRQTYESIDIFGARAVGKACTEAGVPALISMSAIGADEASKSVADRSRARGEAAVREAYPAAIITRASVIFGRSRKLRDAILWRLALSPPQARWLSQESFRRCAGLNFKRRMR